MAPSFEADYAWQAALLPEVRRILSWTFGIPPTDVSATGRESDDDRYQNTDAWIMLEERPKRVSLRLRRYIVRDEFTLRYTRPGTATEWGKLWQGFGDYFLYGKGSSSGLITDWFVGDLAVFRRWVTAYLDAGQEPPHTIQTNKDRSSTFIAFSLADQDPEFVVAADPDAELRDAWWAIVKDSKGMNETGHGAAVRWARASLGLDDEEVAPSPHVATKTIHVHGWAQVAGTWTCIQDYLAVGLKPETGCGETWTTSESAGNPARVSEDKLEADPTFSEEPDYSGLPF